MTALIGVAAAAVVVLALLAGGVHHEISYRIRRWRHPGMVDLTGSRRG